MTLIEVLVVLVVIVALTGMCLPQLSSVKVKAPRLKCVSNLKQVGLAFRIFAGDNNDKYPFEATNSMVFQRASNAWMHFQAMSNELASAKVLMCPSDARLQRSMNDPRDFSNSPMGLTWPAHQDLSVSYFVGLGARGVWPQSILTGDRHIAKSKTSPAYSSLIEGGAIAVAPTSIWLSGTMHSEEGNIVLGDGSVKQAISSRQLGDQLQAAVNLYGITNNYFLFPQ